MRHISHIRVAAAAALLFSAPCFAQESGAPRLGPPIPVTGPQTVPNLALQFAPRTPDADREIAHESETYWKARKEWEAEGKSFDDLPPDTLTALVQEVYRRRLEARSLHRQGRLQADAAQAVAGWRSLGPTNQGGRVSNYAFTPDGSTLYVASAFGGIWKLTRQGGPGGDYVNPVSLTDDLPILTFGPIAVAPSSPNVVYASSGEGSTSGHRVAARGFLRSGDGGATWTLLKHVTQYSYALSVNPNDPNDVLLAAAEGIFRTRDGGQSWTLKHQSRSVAFQGTAMNFQRRPDNPNVLWAGLWGGIAKSIDGGETWNVYLEDLAARTGYPGMATRSVVAMSPSNPNRMYWFVGGTRTETGEDTQIGIFRTDDGGTNWSRVLGEQSLNSQERIAGSQAWAMLAMAVDPTNPDRVFAGGLDMWRSEDAGLHWTKISQWTLPERHPQYCHADIRTVVFEPGSKTFWVGSDGGLFRSVDSGRSFIWKNDGVVIRLFASLAQHPTDPYKLYAGTQDNGTNVLSANNPSAWKMIHGGDGYDCLVNYKNPNIVYATYYNCYTERADDGGAGQSSFRDVTCNPDAETFDDCPLAAVTTFRSRLAMDPVDPNRIYTLTDRLYYTTKGADAASDWKPMYDGYFCREGYSTTPCRDGYASCTAISVNAGNGGQVAFAAGKNWDDDSHWGKLYYTLDGFERSFYIATDSHVNAIAWDPLVKNAVYIGLERPEKLGNATAPHTLYWISNLDTTPNIVALDDGLGLTVSYATGPVTYRVPIDSLAVSPKDGNLLFAGTKFGIYRTTDGGESWKPFGTDLPATWIGALLFSPDGSKIRAATWGRGLWEANPTGGVVGGGTPPTAGFTFSPAAPRPGQTVTFTDQSGNGVSSWSWTFNDGGTSTAQNPTHVFPNPGNYLVTQTVSNAAGTKTASKLVTVSYGSTGSGNVYTYLLPVVLSAPGAGGAFFTSEVTLTNRADHPITLTFRTAGSFSGTATYTLAPGQQVVPEIFAFLALRGMTVTGGDKVTSLRIEVAGADNLAQFGAMARVTTPPSASLRALGIKGRFGLSFPATPLGRGAKERAIVYGLQQTADPPSPGTRSNLGCVHAGSGSLAPIQLEITYHDGDTGQEHPARSTLTLSAFQFAQENQPLASRGIRSGFATIRKISGDDQFVCYAAVNDNVTGDGAFQPMVVDDVSSTTPFAVVPVVLETDTFQSEATLANRTNRSISGLFALVPAGDPTPQWGYFNLDPGTQFTVPNLFAALREVGFEVPKGTVASLVFQLLDGEFDPTSDTQPGVPTTEGFLGIRTYTTRANGKLGLAYAYSPVGAAADTEAFVYGLQQNGVRGQEGATRSNLAVVHALGGEIRDLTLDVTYFGPDGKELGKEPSCAPCTLKPGEWRQFNTPLDRFHAAHGYARIRRLEGSDQFLAYGVLNDQANDDGSYVPMVVP